MISLLLLASLLDGLGPRIVLEPAGDHDGDGCQDVLVGLPDGYGVDDAGFVQLRSGADGSLLREHRGARRWERFGFALASGADLDGDGIEDYAIGAPSIFVEIVAGAPDLGDEGRSRMVGRIVVHSGVDGRVLARSEASCLHTGFGAAIDMAAIEPGRTAIVVGSPRLSWMRNREEPETEDVPVVLQVGTSSHTLFEFAEGELTIRRELPAIGSRALDKRMWDLGEDLQLVSDVDGDGCPELAIANSERFEDSSQAARVDPSTPTTESPLARRVALVESVASGSGEVLWSQWGQEGLSGLARSLAALPDVDGDQIQELVVGTSNRGVTALSGREGEILWHVEQTEFRPYDSNMGFGESLSLAGLVDDDDVVDVLAGSYDVFWSEGGLNAGYEQELWCYSGRTGEHLGSFRERAEGLQGVGLRRADGTSLVVVGVIDETPQLLAFPATALAHGEVRREDVELAWIIDLLPADPRGNEESK